MSVGALLWVMDHAPCPSSSAFAVLVVYANFANENGRSYPAASTVAAKTRQNIKTVRAAIDALVHVGLLLPTGRKVGATGNIPVYALGMEGLPKVGSLRGETALDTSATATGPLQTSTEEAYPEMGSFADASSLPESGSKPTQIRVGEPVLEPSPPEDASHLLPPGGRKRRARGFEDWQVPPIKDLPQPQRAIAEQWEAAQPGAYAAEGEGHRQHLRTARASVRRNADASWLSRLVDIRAKPLRDAKAGAKLVISRGVPPTDDVRLIAAEQQASLYRRIGRVDDAAEAQRNVDAIRARMATGGG